jgi:hypothetical protein
MPAISVIAIKKGSACSQHLFVDWVDVRIPSSLIVVQGGEGRMDNLTQDSGLLSDCLASAGRRRI